VNLVIVLVSYIVGILIGISGTGGGALISPVLIIFFSIKPETAIASDLVATLFIRPFGAAIHLAKKTVDLKLVALLSIGSVPAAFLGSYVLSVLGKGHLRQIHLEIALGVALLIAVFAMTLRQLLSKGDQEVTLVQMSRLKAFATVFLGAFGGFLVGLTSVGAGSLMIVILSLMFPNLKVSKVVGTDLMQAIFISAAASLGALTFDHVNLVLSGSIVFGGIPGIITGSLIAPRLNPVLVRSVIILSVGTLALFILGLPPVVVLSVTGFMLVVFVIAKLYFQRKHYLIDRL
jgi:uncharacterized membrane protein YfcA